MAKYLFGDIVREIKEKVDRDNNPYDYFIAGDHMDTDELHLLRRGLFEGSDVGPAFIRVFKPGQVLYGSRRTYLRKVAVADFEGVTANTTFVLESKDESILLQSLLPFIMQSDRFVQHSIKRSKGSTNPYVLFSDLADYEVDLPDIHEQKRLSEVLWAIDSVKMSYKRLISATDDLVKSQFMEQFNLSQAESNGWSIVPLSSVVIKPLSGEWGQEDTDGTGVKVLRTTNFTDSGRIDYSEVVRRSIELKKVESKALRDGDILIEKSGGSDTKPVGRVIFYQETSENYLFNNFTALLRPNTQKLNSRFLFTFLFVTYWNGGTKNYENKTTGIHNLKLEDYLDNTMIPIPPIEDQEAFAEFVRQSDKSKFELEQALSELTATYKRIISDNLG